MNAGVAATNAARLYAAAEAASLRVGQSSAAPGSDRGEPQIIRRPLRAPHVRVTIEVEVQRENQARTAGAFARRGPSPLFMAQYLGQETASGPGDQMTQAEAVARYPSLELDQDILLPGEDAVFAADIPRVDVYV